MTPDLVVAGNLLLDDLVRHDGETRMGEPGGGALYVSLSASLWDVKVGLVSLLGTDYPRRALDALRAHAVDLEGVRAIETPALRTWLLYEKTGRQIVRQLENPSHASVSPGFREFPERYLHAKAVHVCPMPFDLQRDLVGQLVERGIPVTLDPHETVRADNLDTWRGFLAGIRLFFLSHEELKLERAATDPEATLAHLMGRSPGSACLLKRADEGGLLVDTASATARTWTSRSTRVADTTGAGDAFAGGVLAGWLRGESWERALQRGVVSASYAIESWGPEAIIAATPAAAERRLSDWFGAGDPSSAAARAATPGALPS